MVHLEIMKVKNIYLLPYIIYVDQKVYVSRDSVSEYLYCLLIVYCIFFFFFNFIFSSFELLNHLSRIVFNFINCNLFFFLDRNPDDYDQILRFQLLLLLLALPTCTPNFAPYLRFAFTAAINFDMTSVSAIVEMSPS